MRALVFAYHDVGVRALRVLLHHGVEIAAVVTHHDDSSENLWFGSVASLAQDYGLPLVFDSGDNAPLLELAQRTQPDALFSFYFRRLLPAAMLELPRVGCFNLHGSLLPDFAGRAPVNWAVLMGAERTGATLHLMTAKADAGEIVHQVGVPILQDDDAHQVFQKVSLAAETCLFEAMPGILRGDFPRRPQDLSQRRYFGRRTPEDGRIDWHWPAQQMHNLVRAVAPPYPGAFGESAAGRLALQRSRVLRGEAATQLLHANPALKPGRLLSVAVPSLHGRRCVALRGGDDAVLLCLAASLQGQALDPLDPRLTGEGIALL